MFSSGSLCLRPKLLLVFFLVLSFFPCTELRAQDLTDYSITAHWAGAAVLEGRLGPPLIVGDLFLVVDGNGALRAVDGSDPYNPVVLPTISLPEPISGIFGPHEGCLYAAGPDFLYVLDADSFEILTVVLHAAVSEIVFGDSIGAMVSEEGTKFLVFDSTVPLVLPELGSISGYWSTPDIQNYGDYFFLTGWYIGSGVVAIDASDPTAPEKISQFGWYDLWKNEYAKSSTWANFSFGAFFSNDLYTLESYSFYESATEFREYRAYVTRWDFQDPMNPVELARGNVAGDHLSPVNYSYNVQGDELLSVIGSRIIMTDLSAPDLDKSLVKVGLGPEYHILGMVRTEDLLVVSSTSGVLHFFRDQQVGSPSPVSFDGGEYVDSALAENCSMKFSLVEIRDEALQAIVYDLTDTFNPVPISNSSDSYNSYSDCAVSPSCFVLFDPQLIVKNIESGEKAAWPIEVDDFIFLDPFIGAYVNEDGMFVIDTTNPENLVTLANPSSSASICLSHVPGNSSLVAVLGGNGDLVLWNMEVPEEPVQIGSVLSEIDLIIPQGGGPGNLLACVYFQHDGWPGATLQMVDLDDPGQPMVAGTLDLPALPQNTWLHESLLYMACGSAGLIIVDVSDPMTPVIHGGLGTDSVSAVRVEGGNLLLQGSDLFVLPLDDSSLVPVMVTDFAATSHDGFVDLQWQMALGGLVSEIRILRLWEETEMEIPTWEGGQFWSAQDRSPEWGISFYRLEQRISGEENWVSLGEVSINRFPPEVPRLLKPSPNPFNPRVTLACELPHDTHARIRLIDITGRVVRVLYVGMLSSGNTSFIWDGTDSAGHLLPSGTYIAELVTDGNSVTQKLQLIR